MKEQNNSQELFENAKKNSCVTDKIIVLGEHYVSKDAKKQKKIKKGIKSVLAVAAISATLIGITVYGSQSDFIDEVRNETVRTTTTQNPIGGAYEKQNVYDQQFIDYVNDLDSSELNQLFEEASKELKENGSNSELSVSTVVKEMESNYLESLEEVKTR